MAPMPTSKKPKNANPNFLYATNVSDGSSSPTSSSPPSSTDPAKSQCSSLSDGESFEGYGENELGSIHLNHGGQLHDGSNNERKINLTGSGVELELKPHSGHSSTPQQQDDDLNILPRDNWARMSLRRTPNSNPDSLANRRWGSMRQPKKSSPHCKLSPRLKQQHNSGISSIALGYALAPQIAASVCSHLSQRSSDLWRAI
uniref:Uncharacterized protein n=1 Tax=Glossina austeni TaxID=7395 RepID=A0A1A9URZ0_GLOAU